MINVYDKKMTYFSKHVCRISSLVLYIYSANRRQHDSVHAGTTCLCNAVDDDMAADEDEIVLHHHMTWISERPHSSRK
jgi:hypothetical protein